MPKPTKPSDKTEKSARGRRAGLTRAKVIEAALTFADANGVESLTMRALAQSLGVEAMSLYNHIANKDDLIGALLERVAAEFHAPKAGPDWIAELRQRAVTAHQVLTRHAWAPLLMASRITAGPNMLSYVDATLGCLTGAGFDPLMADRIWNALDSHIYGFTILDLRFPFAPETYAQAARDYLPMIPQDRLPHLHALTTEVAEGRHYGVQDFTFGLDLLLSAIATLPRKST